MNRTPQLNEDLGIILTAIEKHRLPPPPKQDPLPAPPKPSVNTVSSRFLKYPKPAPVAKKEPSQSATNKNASQIILPKISIDFPVIQKSKSKDRSREASAQQGLSQEREEAPDQGSLAPPKGLGNLNNFSLLNPQSDSGSNAHIYESGEFDMHQSSFFFHDGRANAMRRELKKGSLKMGLTNQQWYQVYTNPGLTNGPSTLTPEVAQSLEMNTIKHYIHHQTCLGGVPPFNHKVTGRKISLNNSPLATMYSPRLKNQPSISTNNAYLCPEYTSPAKKPIKKRMRVRRILEKKSRDHNLLATGQGEQRFPTHGSPIIVRDKQKEDEHASLKDSLQAHQNFKKYVESQTLSSREQMTKRSGQLTEFPHTSRTNLEQSKAAQKRSIYQSINRTSHDFLPEEIERIISRNMSLPKINNSRTNLRQKKRSPHHHPTTFNVGKGSPPNMMKFSESQTSLKRDGQASVQSTNESQFKRETLQQRRNQAKNRNLDTVKGNALPPQERVPAKRLVQKKFRRKKMSIQPTPSVQNDEDEPLEFLNYFSNDPLRDRSIGKRSVYESPDLPSSPLKESPVLSHMLNTQQMSADWSTANTDGKLPLVVRINSKPLLRQLDIAEMQQNSNIKRITSDHFNFVYKTALKKKQ